MYAIRFTYDNRETRTGNCVDYLDARRKFDGWKANFGHYPELAKIELLVRGEVEDVHPSQA